MTLFDKTRVLRARLEGWAGMPEWSALVRYELAQKPSASVGRRLQQRLKRAFRVLGLNRSWYLKQFWHAGLKHADCAQEAKPLLIWSEEHDRRYVRDACEGMRRLLVSHPELTPILVTEVAEFAFYSRLGWLVEYLPRLGEEGDVYRDRKRRYLAWRYRHALAVPVSAGLASQAEWDELLRSGAR